MGKFVVRIEETLAKDIEIDADNGLEAVDEVKRRYRKGEIVLYAEDYICTDFTVENQLTLEEEL